MSWLKDYHGQLHIICYEKLKEHPAEVVQNAVGFVSKDIQIRNECLYENSEGNFKRTTEKVKVADQFDESMMDEITIWIERVKGALFEKNLVDCTKYF